MIELVVVVIYWTECMPRKFGNEIRLPGTIYIISLGKLLFSPPFYFVFYISSLLSYIKNNFSYELARPTMGTIFLVYIYYSTCNFVLITRKEGGA